ncbi:MAG: hypothetical protein ISN29_01980 [Gammaproteobacteria bacterium AqS3]|nr:hypothetical protein [Gammaproteobacteria bacterium AqS3]
MNDLFWHHFVWSVLLAWGVVYEIIPQAKSVFFGFFSVRKYMYIELSNRHKWVNGDTLIHHIVRHGESDGALLAAWRAGCDVNAVNEVGETPRQVAEKNGDDRKLQILDQISKADDLIVIV